MTIRKALFLPIAFAMACAGTQQVQTNAENGSMEPLRGEIDELALLPSHLAAGEEPPEDLGVSDWDEDSLVVEGLEDVDTLTPLAVTTEIEMLVEAEGERIPLRVALMSYEDGLHVYDVETMTAYDEEGRACTSADAAARFLVSEAREGRWSTHLLDPESLGTEMPSTVRMTLMDEGNMYSDLVALGDVLAKARVLRARMGDEVVVYSRDPQDLDFFQAVIRIDPYQEELTIMGPPHVRVSRITPETILESGTPAKL